MLAQVVMGAGVQMLNVAKTVVKGFDYATGQDSFPSVGSGFPAYPRAPHANAQGA